LQQQPSNTSIDQQTSFQMGQPPPIMMQQQFPPSDQIDGVAPDPLMQNSNSSMGVMDYGRIQQHQPGTTFTQQQYQQQGIYFLNRVLVPNIPFSEKFSPTGW